jgi:hypothetical protein
VRGERRKAGILINSARQSSAISSLAFWEQYQDLSVRR